MISSIVKNSDKLLNKNLVFFQIKLNCSSLQQQTNKIKSDEENKNIDLFHFEPPEIFKSTEQEDIVKIRDARQIGEKLEKRSVMDLPADMDWPSSWPTAQTFDPNRVPLPVYQGAPLIQREFRTKMNRWQNTELMKIPNFLHLTPEAIKRQTDALRKYCTKWPENLDDKKLDKLFPVTVYSQDRVNASPSIRDPLARKITIEFNIDELKLDEHAKDKLIKLLGERYNKRTGLIKIETDSCPFKDQNLELSIYRLTACYFEAWKKEEWEKDEE